MIVMGRIYLNLKIKQEPSYINESIYISLPSNTKHRKWFYGRHFYFSIQRNLVKVNLISESTSMLIDNLQMQTQYAY